MSDYAKHLAEHRRLAILRFLTEALDYSLNESILCDLLAHFGMRVSRDMLRADIAWLADLSLVTVDKALEDVDVVRLTERGNDVAAGRTVVPGIKRPSP